MLKIGCLIFAFCVLCITSSQCSTIDDESIDQTLAKYGNPQNLLGEGTEAFVFLMQGGSPDEPPAVMRILLTSDKRRDLDRETLLHFLQEKFITNCTGKTHSIMHEVTTILMTAPKEQPLKRISVEEHFETASNNVRKLAAIRNFVLETDIPLYEGSIEIGTIVTPTDSYPLIEHISINRKYDGVVGHLGNTMIPWHSVLKLFYGWYHDQLLFLNHIGALHSDPHMWNLLYLMDPKGVPTFVWSDFTFDHGHHWIGGVGILEWYESLLFDFCENALPSDSTAKSVLNAIMPKIFPLHKTFSIKEYFPEALKVIRNAFTGNISCTELSAVFDGRASEFGLESHC